MKIKKSTRKFLKNSLHKKKKPVWKSKSVVKSCGKKESQPTTSKLELPLDNDLDLPDLDDHLDDLDASDDDLDEDHLDDAPDHDASDDEECSDAEEVQELDQLEKILAKILNSKDNEKELAIKKFCWSFKKVATNKEEISNLKVQEFIIFGILQEKVLMEISTCKNSKKYLLSILKSFILLKKSDCIKWENLLKISNLQLLFKELSNLKDSSKKELVRTLLKEFQIGQDVSKEEISAFIIARFIALKVPKLLEIIFKSFIKILETLRISNSRNFVKVKFINSCLVELGGLSLGTTCSLGFLGIRELALQLKTCLSSTDFKEVQTWAFISKIKIWALIISTYATPELLHLVYPLVQVSVGVLRLSINSRNFPMHTTILQSLVELSTKTGVFIPISSYLMDILSHSELVGRAKPSTAKPLDLSVYLTVPSGYQGTTVYQKGLFEGILNLFYDYLAIPSISFPEISVPVTVFLKRWTKKCKNAYMNKNMRVLLEKIQEQVSWTEQERLNISPMDLKEAVEWTRNVQGSPLQIYNSKRKTMFHNN
jgi:hypothetical protein